LLLFSKIPNGDGKQQTVKAGILFALGSAALHDPISNPFGSIDNGSGMLCVDYPYQQSQIVTKD
jgi:hypothetical protein